MVSPASLREKLFGKPKNNQLPIFDPLNNQQYWNPPQTQTPDPVREAMLSRYRGTSTIPTGNTQTPSTVSTGMPKGRGSNFTRTPTPAAPSHARLALETAMSRRANEMPAPRSNSYQSGELAMSRNANSNPGVPGVSQIQAPVDPNEGLMAQMLSLMNQPDIPGQWISPYSQEYLNQLGGKLAGAGEQANASFGAANQEILDNYAASGAATNQISDANQADIGANLANLGLNYGNMEMSQQWDADQAQMNQVAAQNQATDQSYNTKMGSLFQNLGSHYGDMAREGILTPKQWVGPQSGISEGERMQVDFLKEQYNRNLDNLDYESQMKMEQEMMNELNGTSTQEMEHINPLFSQTLGSIQDPQVKEAVLTAYNLAGGDIPKALQLVTERQQQNKPGMSNKALAQGARPVVRDLAGGGNVFQSMAKMLGNANAGNRAKSQQDAIDQQVLQYLMGISPTITGVPTLRSNLDVSKTQNKSGTSIRT